MKTMGAVAARRGHTTPPPVPPCNPGQQCESQTVRDGDANGGRSPSVETRERGDDVSGPHVGGLGNHNLYLRFSSSEVDETVARKVVDLDVQSP